MGDTTGRQLAIAISAQVVGLVLASASAVVTMGEL